jgi:hypothetical protein
MFSTEGSMRRLDLLPDCASCSALCCVAPSFEASEDFAHDKPSGTRCTNLNSQNRCGVYGQRELLGFRGCIAFDCYGAGQRATRERAGEPERQERFLALRDLHEQLFLLTEAIQLCPPGHTELRARLSAQVAELDATGAGMPDASAREARVHGLLREVGAALGGVRPPAGALPARNRRCTTVPA